MEVEWYKFGRCDLRGRYESIYFLYFLGFVVFTFCGLALNNPLMSVVGCLMAITVYDISHIKFGVEKI